MAFLGWVDIDKKKSATAKLRDAIVRYEQRRGEMPTLALVNSADFEQLEAFAGIEIQAVRHVAKDTFFVGCEADQNPLH